MLGNMHIITDEGEKVQHQKNAVSVVSLLPFFTLPPTFFFWLKEDREERGVGGGSDD